VALGRAANCTTTRGVPNVCAFRRDDRGRLHSDPPMTRSVCNPPRISRPTARAEASTCVRVQSAAVRPPAGGGRTPRPSGRWRQDPAVLWPVVARPRGPPAGRGKTPRPSGRRQDPAALRPVAARPRGPPAGRGRTPRSSGRSWQDPAALRPVVAGPLRPAVAGPLGLLRPAVASTPGLRRWPADQWSIAQRGNSMARCVTPAKRLSSGLPGRSPLASRFALAG
jgi:hypothetical protein